MRQLYPFTGPAVLLAVWCCVSYGGLVKPILLPYPDSVAVKLVNLFWSGAVFTDLFATLYRWFAGCGIGVLVGIPVGLAMGAHDPTRRSLMFLVDCVRSVPVIALFPLFVIFLGIGNSSKIAIAAWAGALSVLVNSMYGAARTKRAWILAAKSFRATPGQVFEKIVVPGALPEVFVGLRIAVSHTLVLVVASEMVLGGTNTGLGQRLSDAAMIYRTPEVYALIIVIGFLGYFSNFLLVRLEKNIVPWADQ